MADVECLNDLTSTLAIGTPSASQEANLLGENDQSMMDLSSSSDLNSTAIPASLGGTHEQSVEAKSDDAGGLILGETLEGTPGLLVEAKSGVKPKNKLRNRGKSSRLGNKPLAGAKSEQLVSLGTPKRSRESTDTPPSESRPKKKTAKPNQMPPKASPGTTAPSEKAVRPRDNIAPSTEGSTVVTTTTCSIVTEMAGATTTVASSSTNMVTCTVTSATDTVPITAVGNVPKSITPQQKQLSGNEGTSKPDSDSVKGPSVASS